MLAAAGGGAAAHKAPAPGPALLCHALLAAAALLGLAAASRQWAGGGAARAGAAAGRAGQRHGAVTEHLVPRHAAVSAHRSHAGHALPASPLAFISHASHGRVLRLKKHLLSHPPVLNSCGPTPSFPLPSVQVPPGDPAAYRPPRPAAGLAVDPAVLWGRGSLLDGPELEQALTFGDSRRLRRQVARLMAGVLGWPCTAWVLQSG